jgi:hypothetical protein
MNDYVRNLVQRSIGVIPMIEPSLMPAFSPTLTFDTALADPVYDIPVRPNWTRGQEEKKTGGQEDRVTGRQEVVIRETLTSEQPVSPARPHPVTLSPLPPAPPAPLSPQVNLGAGRQGGLQPTSGEVRVVRDVVEKEILRESGVAGKMPAFSPSIQPKPQINAEARVGKMPAIQPAIHPTPPTIITSPATISPAPIHQHAHIINQPQATTPPSTRPPTNQSIPVIQPTPTSSPPRPLTLAPLAAVTPTLPPPVEVKIGTIEIKGTPPPVQAPVAPHTPPQPKGFSNYANWRGGG